MRVAVAGSSGFVGGELLPRLVDAGHEVGRLVRRGTAGQAEASKIVDLREPFYTVVALPAIQNQ